METEDIAVKLEAVDSRSRSNTPRIDALERHQAENDKMLNTIALIAQRQDTMDVDIKEIKTAVNSLAAKPARRWATVVAKPLLALAAGLAAYTPAHLGM